MKSFAVLFLTCFLTASQVLSQAVDYEYSQKEEYYDQSGEEQIGEETVNEPPPLFLHKSKAITVREGDPLELSCETVKITQHVLLFKKETSEQSNKVKQLILFAGASAIYRSNFKVKNLKYSLKHVGKTDDATYLCVYQTQRDGDIQIKYEVNVEYPPHIKSMKPTRQMMKGDNVSFECKADGNPKPKVKWSRENGKLPSGTMEEKGKTIIFMDVDRHVEGTYLCTADNGIGKPKVISKKLLVQYPPEIITEKAILRTGNGDTLELTCIVHSRPHATVTWSRESEILSADNNSSKQLNGGHRHSLTIPQVTEKNLGLYTCTATNIMGNTSADINLTDLPMKPDFTSDPTSADDNKYTLTWDTESYYPITQYRIKYRPLTANASDDASWKEDSFEITAEEAESNDLVHKMKHSLSGLNPATDYEAIVSVKNELKWGDISSFLFSTKKESASQITGKGSLLSASIALIITSRMVSVIS